MDVLYFPLRLARVAVVVCKCPDSGDSGGLLV